jgi:hypothetical protein
MLVVRPLFALLMLGGVASAQPVPGEDSPAISLFKEGLALLDGNQAAAACEKFEASLKLEPDAAGPMLNLGICNEQLDKLATALHWFRRVETRAAELQITDAETAAKEKSTALAAKVPTIKITFSQPQPHGSAVAVDGRKLDDVDLARFELDAGHHVVELVGFDSAKREIDIADGDAKTVELVVPLPPPPPVKKQYTYVDDGADQRRLAYIVGGVGAGLLIGDGVLLAIAKHEFDGTEHPDTKESWRNVARYGGTSVFIVGAGAVAGAAWLYFRAPSHERVEQTVVAPVIDRAHVGLAFSGAF